MAKALWVETYRPKTIDEYVFKDPKQRKTVEGWIKDKSIPHLLFHGGAGTGKCLGPDELIEVEINDSDLTDVQLAMLSQFGHLTWQQTDNKNYKDARNLSMTTYNVPIGTLFEVLGLSQSELNIVEESKISVNIQTPTGFAPINGFVRKKVPASTYKINDFEMTCADGHLVQSNSETVRIENASMIDTVNGVEAVIHGRDPIGEIIVYDVCLPEPHLYVTPNGLIHHNTTLARVLVNELGVQDADFMYINASRDNGVDLIRERVTRFASSMPWGDFKIVLLDEADYISPAGQAALRGVMEEYSTVLRFILTCNYANRIIPAIKSRSQEFHISNQDQTDFTARVAEILITEGVDVDIDTIDTYVRATYPDLRKTINAVQQNIIDGKLVPPDDQNEMASDWRLKMVSLFREKNLRAARELICKNATPDDFEDMFKFLYRNLDFFGSEPEQQDAAVIIIRNGLVKHTMIADPELNFSATMIELENI